jgi:hypothetical protein
MWFRECEGGLSEGGNRYFGKKYSIEAMICYGIKNGSFFIMVSRFSTSTKGIPTEMTIKEMVQKD